jgi:hypothetical protein
MSESPLTHPTDNDLRELSLGRLAATDLYRVCAHLGDCRECCHRVDELAPVDPLLTRLEQSAEDREGRLVGAAQRHAAVRTLGRARAARAAGRRGEPETDPVILPALKKVGQYEIPAEVGRCRREPPRPARPASRDDRRREFRGQD